MNKALFSTGKDLWETPKKFFDELNNEFHFTLDACATAENAKCEKYFTEKDNALIQDWGGEHCFLQSSVFTARRARYVCEESI